MVIANRRYTDLFEWGQRTTPFTLSGEIQRRLLPSSFTCEGSSFTLSGWLEPAANIGGDTFDYSIARHVLHFSVTDAMGHGVASALTATLGVGSLRNSRRRGVGLVEQAAAANADWKNAKDFALVMTNAPGENAWPITATNFILMRKQPKNADGARNAREFFRWVYANGDDQARALGYVPLPDSLVRQVETYWTTALPY